MSVTGAEIVHACKCMFDSVDSGIQTLIEDEHDAWQHDHIYMDLSEDDSGDSNTPELGHWFYQLTQAEQARVPNVEDCPHTYDEFLAHLNDDENIIGMMCTHCHHKISDHTRSELCNRSAEQLMARNAHPDNVNFTNLHRCRYCCRELGDHISFEQWRTYVFSKLDAAEQARLTVREAMYAVHLQCLHKRDRSRAHVHHRLTDELEEGSLVGGGNNSVHVHTRSHSHHVHPSRTFPDPNQFTNVQQSGSSRENVAPSHHNQQRGSSRENVAPPNSNQSDPDFNRGSFANRNVNNRTLYQPGDNIHPYVQLRILGRGESLPSSLTASSLMNSGNSNNTILNATPQYQNVANNNSNMTTQQNINNRNNVINNPANRNYNPLRTHLHFDGLTRQLCHHILVRVVVRVHPHTRLHLMDQALVVTVLILILLLTLDQLTQRILHLYLVRECLDIRQLALKDCPTVCLYYLILLILLKGLNHHLCLNHNKVLNGYLCRMHMEQELMLNQ